MDNNFFYGVMKAACCIVFFLGGMPLLAQKKSWLISLKNDDPACKTNRNWLDDRCDCDNSDLCCASCAVQISAPAMSFATGILSALLTPICCPSCGLIAAVGIPCVITPCALAAVCYCINRESERMYPDDVRENGMSKDPYENL